MSISNLAQTISDLAAKVGTDIGGIIKQLNGWPTLGTMGKTLIQAADQPTALTALGVPSALSLGFRNKLINGGFTIQQRGSSDRPDCWMLWSGSGTLTCATVTDLPGTSNGMVLNATGAAYAVQRLPGNTSQALVGSTCTVSFWAKCASGTPTLVVELYSPTTSGGFGTLGSFHHNAVTLTTTWQKYTATFPVLESTYANGLQLVLGVAAAASAITLTQVQLEGGSIATPFEYKPQGLELQLAQRYYWRRSSLYEILGTGNGTSGGQAVGIIRFPQPMRSYPTITTSTVSGNFNLIGAGGGYLPVTSLVFSNASAYSAWWTAQVDAATLTGGQATFLWTNSATAYIEGSADL